MRDNIDFTPRQSIRTRIIWSFSHDVISEKLADIVTNERFDALRLVYFPSMKNNILKFLQAVQQKNGGSKIPVMLDIALKIRATVSDLEKPRTLQTGEKIRLVPKKNKRNDLVVRTDEWADLFALDSIIYIGTGDVILKCLDVQPNAVTAEVIQGEAVYPHAPIKVPRTNKDLTASDLMITDIEQFLTYNIDFIVIPGITSREEILRFRQFLQKKTSSPPWIILKVDTLKVYQKIEHLITAVDGVLISRREIALTTNPATVPMIAKEVIQLCRENFRLAITASEILGSMRYNPTPTRAEVSDIANAVIDGTDVIVLPEDLCLGKYFMRSLHLVYDIIADIESNMVEPNWHIQEPSIKTEYDALTTSAYQTARRIKAKALVCLTQNGETALRLSRFRTPIPIIAVTFCPKVLKRLRLLKGVTGILLDTSPSLDEVLPMVNDHLRQESPLKFGDQFILVTISLSPIGRAASNLFTVQTIS